MKRLSTCIAFINFAFLTFLSINPLFGRPRIKTPDFEIENFIIPQEIMNSQSEESKNIIFIRNGYKINPITYEVSKEESITHIFYASSFESNILLEVTVIDLSREGYRQILYAESGSFNKNQGVWIFTNGSLITINPTGNKNTIDFETYNYPFEEIK